MEIRKTPRCELFTASLSVTYAFVHAVNIALNLRMSSQIIYLEFFSKYGIVGL